MEPMHPDNVLVAFGRLRQELTFSLGEDCWEEVFEKIKQLRDTKEPGERDKIASELVDLVSHNDRVRKKLKDEIYIQHNLMQSLHKTIGQDISSLALDTGVDEKAFLYAATGILRLLVLKSVVADTTDPHRTVELKPEDFTSGKSIKIRNFRLNKMLLLELAAELTLTASGSSNFSPEIVGTAGALLTFRSLRKAMTIPLSEREASVFWGLVVAQGDKGSADETSIVTCTNNERENAGLNELNKDQIKKSLQRLAELGSIENLGKKPHAWRIVENYRVDQ